MGNPKDRFSRSVATIMDTQRGSCMVWEINMGVCPRLDFETIMLFYCLGYNFNIYGAFEFFMQFHS